MGLIYKGGVFREMTASEKAAEEAIQKQIADGLAENEAKAARMLRDGRLAECDGTQAADSPLSADQKAAWATYRASLRNLPTADEKWPNSEEITWPTQPE